MTTGGSELATAPEATPDSTGGGALVLDDVHAYIGQSHILHGVSLVAPSSAVTVILGRNGVGKTSTIRAVLGLLPPTGSIRFGGTELVGSPTHRIAQMGIAYVPEDRDVFHGLTVRENLRLAERRGHEPNYDRVYGVFPELGDRANQSCGTLSGGQQQMVSLARALLNDNRLLLIDEPTKGLAPRLVVEFVEVLERVIQDVTVVVVEQNLAVARRLGTYAVVLAEGKVARSGPCAEVFADERSLRRLVGVDGGRPSSDGDDA